MFYRVAVKPFADRLVAVAALFILSPAMLIIAVFIWVRMGRPVLFTQTRIGRYDQPFLILKFRTMTAEMDGAGCLLPDGERLTGLGRLLRSTSLDELPQFWNVVKGEMSIIGPRPLHPEYLPQYSAVQRRRHEVKPGITGLAQANGRNSLSWDQKFELDVQYVDRCSARVDMQIVLMTFIAILRRGEISPVGQATSPPFLGAAAGHETGRAE